MSKADREPDPTDYGELFRREMERQDSGPSGGECQCLACRMERAAAAAGGGPRAARKAMEREALRERGYYIHYVTDPDAPGAIDAHTHGLDETRGHPDFQLVLAVSPAVAGAILGGLAERVRRGEAFGPRDSCGGVRPDCDVRLARAPEGGRTVLRVIVPDADGNVGRAAMDPRFRHQWDGVDPEDVVP